MNRDKVESILTLLEGIHFYEWIKIKEMVDREFKYKSNKITFKKSEALDFEIKTTISE